MSKSINSADKWIERFSRSTNAWQKCERIIEQTESHQKYEADRKEKVEQLLTGKTKKKD